MAHIYLALGSNLGNRAENLQMAIASLQSFVNVLRVSPVYQTAPWGVVDQPDFLNQVLAGETDLAPFALLERVKNLEESLGRKPSIQYGPRLIDIDILFYEDWVLDFPQLNIPHAHIAERAFVLVPLVDLAPELCHPVSGKTMRELLSKIDHSDVVLYES